MRPMMRIRRSTSSFAILLLVALGLLPGCGGGSSGGGTPPAPQTPTALVVGQAAGTIYDELASAYRIDTGTGQESATGYDVVIYDGNYTSADQIDNLPTTINFLAAGKILIVLNPTPDDRQALDDHLGATALVDDSPAVAAFNTYSKSGLLREVDMVEFPATLSEDAMQTVPPGPSSDSTSAAAQPDAQTLRQQTRQWRATYEATRKSARAAFAGLDTVSSAQLAAAAGGDGSTEPIALDSGAPTGDLSAWLAPPSEITPSSDTTQFLTVQPFRVTRTYTLPLQSIYYQTERFQKVYPKAVQSNLVIGRGLCTFLPINAAFKIPPDTTTYTNVNAEIQTYRILQNANGVYSHEVIAHQFISSIPTITPAPPAPPDFGVETISFCRARTNITPFECVPDEGGCNAFSEDYPLSALRGFNEQIVSNFTWDANTAPRLTLDSWVPLADNDKTTVSTSQVYEKIVTWSIQGTGSIDISKTPKIGLSAGGNYGQQEKWGWSQGTSMSLSAWQMISPGPVDINFPARSIFDFRASVSPNNLANMIAFATPPATSTPPLSFKVGPPDGINNLQAQGLTDRSESDWSTKFKGGLLPPAKATLNVKNTFNYGEIYSLYTLIPSGFFDFGEASVQPYSALHTYTADTIPIQLDFSQPIMQLPIPADWTLTADRHPKPDEKGFFPIDGTVTLNQAATSDTTLYLGAQIEQSGIHRPAPTSIRGLPPTVKIPAGQLSATFTTAALRTGFPYNVQFYAYQTQGKQAVYQMTIPSK
jgi:hypothetical protein